MIRAKRILYAIKYFLQKIFRKNHISDMEIWNCKESLAKYILPRLKALRKEEFFCYPNDDTDTVMPTRTLVSYDDEGNEEVEYDKEKLENWLKIIDEMIFAFEFVLYGDSFGKKQTGFYMKYFEEDPYKNFLDKFEINHEITIKAYQRALKGLEYFGKYFMYLYN